MYCHSKKTEFFSCFVYCIQVLESYSLFNRWKAKNTLLLSLVFSISPNIYIEILQTDFPTFLFLNKKLREIIKRSKHNHSIYSQNVFSRLHIDVVRRK